jgi:hypothetical protein
LTFSNSYTAAALYSALTATFPSVTDKASLISYATENPAANVQGTLWSLGWAGYNGHALALESLATTINLTLGLPDASVFVGRTEGSTLSIVSGAPSGFTISSDAGAWYYDGTGSASSGSVTIRETLGASSQDTVISWAITAPPVLSAGSISGVTSSAATLNITTNTGNGNFEYIVDNHPTWWDGRRYDIQKHFSTIGAYSFAAKSGSPAVTSSGSKTISVTGLTSATTYVAYVVHVNAAGFVSAATYLGSFTTS